MIGSRPKNATASIGEVEMIFGWKKNPEFVRLYAERDKRRADTLALRAYSDLERQRCDELAKKIEMKMPIKPIKPWSWL